MKLYYTEEGEEKALDISYWSFVKCYFLAYLGIVGIIFAVAFGIGLLLGFMGL